MSTEIIHQLKKISEAVKQLEVLFYSHKARHAVDGGDKLEIDWSQLLNTPQKGFVTTDAVTGLASISFSPYFDSKPVLVLTCEGDGETGSIISFTTNGNGKYISSSVKSGTSVVIHWVGLRSDI